MKSRDTQDNELIKSVVLKSNKIGQVTISISSNAEVTIRTNRLILRSLNQIDMVELTKNYKSLLGNYKNVRMFQDGNPWSEERVKAYLTNRVQLWNDGASFSSFSVYDASSNAYIGSFNCNYRAHDYGSLGRGHHNVVEIGFLVDQPHWGNRYGTEIAAAGIKYIKYRTSQQRVEGKSAPDEVVATVHPENLASINILQKTLKNKEDSDFGKYNGQSRIFFFKPLSKDSPKTKSDKDDAVLSNLLP